jgi:hypothetical protein
MILGLVAQAIVGFIMSGLYVKLTETHRRLRRRLRNLPFPRRGRTGKQPRSLGLQERTHRRPWTVLRYRCGYREGRSVRRDLGFPSYHRRFWWCDTSTRGNTGPFWIGSGLALLSAAITFFFVKPLTTDGMAKEDEEFRAYLEANGYDTSQMGLRFRGHPLLLTMLEAIRTGL